MVLAIHTAPYRKVNTAWVLSEALTMIGRFDSYRCSIGF